MGSVVTSRWLVARGAAWVRRRRRVHRPLGQPLPPELSEIFARYFEAETLAGVRVHRVPRIEPPWPIVVMGRMRPLALDFRHVWGITYDDTVVLANDLADEPREISCLFHECVHVAQYRLFGVTGFVRRYVEEWAAAGWRYEGIALECEAYALQRRFACGERFRVEQELGENGTPPAGNAAAQYG